MQGLPTQWHSSVLVRSFRSGSPDVSRKSSRRPPKRCARSRGDGVPRWRRATRPEHGNDGGRRPLWCRSADGPPPFRRRGARRPALHIPVLGRHAVGYLKPRDGGVYIDGTFGAGGYTRAILAAADCKVIGIDRDQTAIGLGADLVEQAGGRLTLIEDRFSNLETIARDARH